ncbi:acyl-CoA dehydrogenase family protein [Peredibacter starrii]|uniref:Acyl-CoA dehydrogenase family protein n=1 Tax=Peredibacter starrii TaxID=28202 RepID=A0AAX4HS17_9BACT|nr:acyl-CoA dehydrogenase family protein [Peredibacter starrii]WPU65851.1 acyl-CoA dehydrogenase family protein [Peredibacter starrii]
MKTFEKSLQVAESSRDEWEKTSFLKDMFMGKFTYDLIHPFPEQNVLKDENFLDFLARYKQFLQDEVDSDLIDREGKIPKQIIDRLKEMKCFALKIGKEYGGHGFTQSEYNEILKLTATKDANIVALLSAHQSIGVPQPLIMFGNEEQKKKYLTRIAQGEISAFALTEPDVGSDPANLETTVTTESDHYVLNGHKLWCTNGTIADVIIVMARHVEDDLISAFIVEMKWEGVKVEHRCHFMGLKALENGVLSFDNVKIPKENLLWERGKGLKLALITLNTGRLSLPAAVAASSKKMLEIARLWCREREQWGKPIYKHEAIAQKIADLASSTFAMGAISDLATALYDNHHDIRLEAAVSKLFCSETGWENVDDLLQMRGGRGYETSDSLRARGEADIPVERMMRDFRINRIFEGTTEIMHLFIAREAVDTHLKVSGVLLDKNKRMIQKILALPKIFIFYALWYPTLWMVWPFGGSNLSFIKRSTKKLARQIFHGMLFYGPGLQNRQMFLFRVVDIATELYVMAATQSKADKLGKDAQDLADVFCENSRRKIEILFRELWHNSDNEKYKLAQRIEKDEFNWLEEGIVETTYFQRKLMNPNQNEVKELHH